MSKLSLAAFIFTLIAQSSGAEVVEVQSGEHENFSRLVFYHAAQQQLYSSRTGAGYEIEFRLTPDDLIASEVFRYIPRSRLKDLRWTGEQVLLEVDCECYLRSFTEGSSITVFDIVDGTNVPSDRRIVRSDLTPHEFGSQFVRSVGRLHTDMFTPARSSSNDWWQSFGRTALDEYRESSSGLTKISGGTPKSFANETGEQPLVVAKLDVRPGFAIEDSAKVANAPRNAGEYCADQRIAEIFASEGRDDSENDYLSEDLFGERGGASFEERPMIGSRPVHESYLYHGFGSEVFAVMHVSAESTKEDEVLRFIGLALSRPFSISENDSPISLACGDESTFWHFIGTGDPSVLSKIDDVTGFGGVYASLPSHIKSYLAPFVFQELYSLGFPNVADDVAVDAGGAFYERMGFSQWKGICRDGVKGSLDLGRERLHVPMPQAPPEWLSNVSSWHPGSEDDFQELVPIVIDTFRDYEGTNVVSLLLCALLNNLTSLDTARAVHLVGALSSSESISRDQVGFALSVILEKSLSFRGDLDFVEFSAAIVERDLVDRLSERLLDRLVEAFNEEDLEGLLHSIGVIEFSRANTLKNGAAVRRPRGEAFFDETVLSRNGVAEVSEGERLVSQGVLDEAAVYNRFDVRDGTADAHWISGELEEFVNASEGGERWSLARLALEDRQVLDDALVADAAADERQLGQGIQINELVQKIEESGRLIALGHSLLENGAQR